MKTKLAFFLVILFHFLISGNIREDILQTRHIRISKTGCSRSVSKFLYRLNFLPGTVHRATLGHVCIVHYDISKNFSIFNFSSSIPSIVLFVFFVYNAYFRRMSLAKHEFWQTNARWKRWPREGPDLVGSYLKASNRTLATSAFSRSFWNKVNI